MTDDSEIAGQNEPQRHPGGRPSKFKPEFVEQAAKLAKLGAIDRDVADFFEVDEATIYRWKHAHPEFCEALKVGKDLADARVEQSLYRRALGYSHDAVKILAVGGEVQKVDYVEHYPPDTTACIFWLKNRDKEHWRDKQEVEHSGGFAITKIENVIVDPAGSGPEGVRSAP